MSGPGGPEAAPGELVERVRARLVAGGSAAGVGELAAAVRAEARGVVGDADVLAAVRDLQRELVGAGPLEALLREPTTCDVLVTAPDAVWVDRGAGLELTPVTFPDEAAVRRLAQRLAAAAGRRLDDASPYVDARLPGSGVRLHAVLPPVAADGTCVSLRVLRPARHDLAGLHRSGTVDAAGLALLRAVVGARLAFLVVGGTGSGKTTLLSGLIGEVPPAERIVCVEDAEELRPRHPHVVRLVSRPANVEGAGQVQLRDLVREALRMRPDRLVVGEVRGAEVCELLAALNTGHDGGSGTVHANSPREVPARLEALAALGGLGSAALHSQLAAAVQIVLHVRRERDGRRVLAAVGVLRRAGAGESGPGGEVTVVPAWTRGGGWALGRADLGALLRERGVDPPWEVPPDPPRDHDRPAAVTAGGGTRVGPGSPPCRRIGSRSGRREHRLRPARRDHVVLAVPGRRAAPRRRGSAAVPGAEHSPGYASCGAPCRRGRPPRVPWCSVGCSPGSAAPRPRRSAGSPRRGCAGRPGPSVTGRGPRAGSPTRSRRSPPRCGPGRRPLRPPSRLPPTPTRRGARALTRVAATARLGGDVPAALRTLAAGDDLPGGEHVERLAAAWALAERHGVGLALPVGAVATDLRARARLAGRVDAQLAGPRATAGVLAALPALGILLGEGIGARPWSVLTGTALGQGLLVVGVALVCAGVLWTARITSGASR